MGTALAFGMLDINISGEAVFHALLRKLVLERARGAVLAPGGCAGAVLVPLGHAPRRPLCTHSGSAPEPIRARKASRRLHIELPPLRPGAAGRRALSSRVPGRQA